MIMKKRKRKHHSDESSEDRPSSDDKYVAYVKKSTKKDKKRAKDGSSSAAARAVLDDVVDTSPTKKSKKKRKADLDDDATTDASIGISSACIVAKPKINKAAVELNAVLKAESAPAGKSKKSKSKKRENQESSPEPSRIEIIMPRVNVAPKIDLEPEEDVDSLEIELSAAERENDYLNMESVIIEANLKKPADSYVPQIIKDCDESMYSKSELPRVGRNESEVDEQVQENKSKRSKENTSNSTTKAPDDIPQALQEFYDEITRNFDKLTREHSKSDKKRRKKSADCHDLIDVVNQRSVTLDNSRSTSQVAQFFSLESKAILVLKPKTQFSFLGKLKLQILYGAAKLYGFVFHPGNTLKPVEVYSPRGYSSVAISTFDRDDTCDKEALWDALASVGVDRSLKTKLHDAIAECADGWCVLLLENFENTLTNFLNDHCKFKLFPKIENNKYSWCDQKRSECVLQSNFQFSDVSSDEISISPQWNESVTSQLLDQWNINQSLRVMVVGGKGVGKSTTARYLINNLLAHSKKVVLLDLDPGQAEMTPAASVSLNVIDEPLLGPNFTHLKTPFYQLYLEDVSVCNCITRYFECMKKLVECYRDNEELSGQYPLVVNTMGFCKGIGLDIVVYLIKLIEPTNVIQIQSKRPKNNFDFALLKKTINERKTSQIPLDGESRVFRKTCNYELHCVITAAEGKRQFETWNMEPRQQRELVLLSYLSQIIENADDKSFCNVASSSINNITPYELPFSSFYVTLVKSSTSPSHILAAMNGNIVALCGIDIDDQTSEEQKKSLKYPMVIIKAPTCTCYGFGIVRGVDMARRLVYINTPLSASLLRHVNLLAGCSPLPFALLHSSSSGQQTAPYSGDKGELPTSREARRGYFRKDQRKS